MKKALLAVICLLFITGIVEAEDIAHLVTPAMKVDFLEKIKTAVAQKDFRAYSALYCQKGTSGPKMKDVKDSLDKGTQEMFKTFCAMSFPEYTIVEPSADQPRSLARQGNIYMPNLKIVLRLQVRDTNGSLTWNLPLGIDDQALTITQAVLKLIN